MLNKCPICNSKDIMDIFIKDNLPRYCMERHLTRESALNAEKESVDFQFCNNCLFLFNKLFDISIMDYKVDFECSRSKSDKFSNYLSCICNELNEIFSIKGKIVAEVGCGDGQFLKILRDKYVFQGWGFEPSLSKSTNNIFHSDLNFIQEYYNINYLKKSPDLIILRHILEHQGLPNEFIRNIIKNNNGILPSNIYIEVPSLEWLLDNDQIYAFSYEHCSYFSMNSLKLVLKNHGYETKKLSYTFENEYLQYFGIKNDLYNKKNSDSSYKIYINNDYKKQIIDKIISFKEKIPIILERLRSYFSNEETVLWGAAGKGSILLNILDMYYKQFPFIVDINPKKQNTFLAVTGQQIISPEYLKYIQPKYVLITNPLYLDEISMQIKNMGIKSEIIIIK